MNLLIDRLISIVVIKRQKEAVFATNLIIITLLYENKYSVTKNLAATRRTKTAANLFNKYSSLKRLVKLTYSN